MAKDFLNACLYANEVLLTGKQVTFSNPWLKSHEHKRMFTEICLVTKKHCNEMKTLVNSFQHQHGRSKTIEHNHGVAYEIGVVKESENRNNTIAIKEENPLEIDDSSVLFMDDGSKQYKLSDKSTEPDKTNQQISNSYEETAAFCEDMVSVVEPEIEQIDLIDSSDDGNDNYDIFYPEENSVGSTYFDEETLNTVCQICGEKPGNMSSHLETHLIKKKPKEKTIEAIAQIEAIQVKPDLSEKCMICGVKLASPLAAKIHSRLHPTSKLKPKARKPGRKKKQLCE